MLVKSFASLYAGAVQLLITGRVGIPILCNFNWAFRLGGVAFFCVKYFIWRLSIIRLHSCIVLYISFWNFSVGSLISVLKLLAVRKECTFLKYSFEFMITIVLPLSVCVTIAFSVANFLLSSFTTYSCHFCSTLD